MIGRARLRLTLWYATIFITTLVVLGGAAYWWLARSLGEEVDRGVRTVVDAWLSTAPEPRELHIEDLERDFEGETADVFLLVFRSDGALIANPSQIEAEEFAESRLVASALGGTRTWGTISEHDSRFRVLAAPIIEHDRVEGVVMGGRSLAAHDRELRLLLWVLGVAGAVGLAMAGLGGYVVAGRALRPIEVAYERQRTFVGDASHELRSPLAVIRASAELLLREPLPDDQRESVSEILDTSVEASGLVEDLLALARLDRLATRAHPGPTDAHDLVQGIVRQMSALFEAHDSTVTISGAPVTVRCDASHLQRTLRAILENTVAHTPAGTPVEVETRTEDGDGLVVVRDRGPGVPPAALDTLFEPFTRADTARTPAGGHTGLGLSIARRLVEADGGVIIAHNRPNGGLEVTVRHRLARG